MIRPTDIDRGACDERVDIDGGAIEDISWLDRERAIVMHRDMVRTRILDHAPATVPSVRHGGFTMTGRLKTMSERGCDE